MTKKRDILDSLSVRQKLEIEGASVNTIAFARNILDCISENARECGCKNCRAGLEDASRVADKLNELEGKFAVSINAFEEGNNLLCYLTNQITAAVIDIQSFWARNPEKTKRQEEDLESRIRFYRLLDAIYTNVHNQIFAARGLAVLNAYDKAIIDNKKDYVDSYAELGDEKD